MPIKISTGRSASTSGLMRAYCTDCGWHGAWEGYEGDALGWADDHLTGSGMNRCRSVHCETWNGNPKRAKCVCNYHCIGCRKNVDGHCCSCCTRLWPAP